MTPSDPLPVLEETPAETGRKGPARHPFFISAPRNLEPLLVDELKELGISGAQSRPLGVEVSLSREEAYRVVYGSRIGSRVLRTLATFPCRDPDELYQQASQFNWSRILKPEQT